jgi:hypothetical protein
MAFFPFGNNGERQLRRWRNLFARVGNTPLPEWAAEFDAKTWAQFFLKYVISHPAVTVARVGTTKAHAHARQHRRRHRPPAGRGDAEAHGGVHRCTPHRYVGEYSAASGFTATIRRDGATLFVKPGTNPEAPLNARSETRFQDPRGPILEFQLDAQGKVTGAILEQQGPQGTQRIPLERK